MRTIYQAEDGATFDTREACELHERGLTLLAYMHKNPLKVATPAGIVRWMEMHHEAVRAFAGVKGGWRETLERDPYEREFEMLRGKPELLREQA